MRKRNDPKPIQGWGWLGDAAEEAAVETMAPARRLKNARAATGMPAKDGMSDDEYRQSATQQYQSEGKIEIEPHARVSRSEDHSGEAGAWVQGWVFVSIPARG